MFVLNTRTYHVMKNPVINKCISNFVDLQVVQARYHSSYFLSKLPGTIMSSFRNKCCFVRNTKSFVNEVFSKHHRLNQSFSQFSPAPSSLQSSKKRITRKKALEKEGLLNVSENNILAFATAKEYNMELLRENLLKDTLYIPSSVRELNCMSLLCVEPASSEGEQKQIFFFEEGAVVFWNIPEDECMKMLKFIKRFEQSSYDSELVLAEQEVMSYSVGNKSDLIGGEIILALDKDIVNILLDKYTFSNAMALSVKIGIWEGILEKYIESMEILTDDVRLGNKIRISRQDVLKKTGELFALRHSINLSSDALDIPDFYWDREELEQIYVKMCNYFSIARRTKVINEKTNHCLELLELLSSHLNDKHHVRLEWMIIILIMVEVGIATIHLAIQ